MAYELLKSKNIELLCVRFQKTLNPNSYNYFIMALKRKSAYFISLLAILLVFLHNPLRADEGMWLISLISRNMEQMQNMGLKLSAEDIYSVNKSCLKDAVVLLDDGSCSAEIISPNGLVLTNHHCAVGDIQLHSSTEHNFLRDGFWAADYESELHIPGKTALILKRVEDVTPRVKELMQRNGDEIDLLENVAEASKTVAEEVMQAEKGVYANVVPMYNNNEFYLFVYNRFLDVRLVGAPPESIGNFGGDVDNWHWPRHTGDFALLRIYASPDGQPAEYSKRNKPYAPKYHFPVSLQGLKEGDFTMVIGYPGLTRRFAPSFHAAHERDVVAPWVERTWGAFIEVVKQAMQEDERVRVNYTDTHDMLVNFWQKDTYQAQSIRRFNVEEIFRQREDSLYQWAMEDPINRMGRVEALKSLDKYFQFLRNNRYEELFRSINTLVQWPSKVSGIIEASSDLVFLMLEEKTSKRKIRWEAKRLAKIKESLFEGFFPQVDQSIYSIGLASLIRNLPYDGVSPLIDDIRKEEHSELIIPLVADYFYHNSIFASPEKYGDFLRKPNVDTLLKDPLLMMYVRLLSFNEMLHDTLAYHKNIYQKSLRDVSSALLEMNQEKLQYPDANSTMRLSYGKVIGYSPRDGVYYRPFTYLKGIIEKENPSQEIFEIPEKLKVLWNRKDFDRYADANGMPVCFITDNDITNGNSGSPVLNANGQLVGVAFDGNYEAMACDFIFEPDVQRTIVTDIRYVLFIIDKFAGAHRLIEEMTIL